MTMNINNLLNQVLGAGQQYNQQSNTNAGGLGGLANMLGGGGSAGGLGGMLQNVLGGNSSGGGAAGALGSLLQNSDQLKGLGAGAAAAGVLSMLMGGGSRGLGGSLAKMGSVAAVGTLAYKAYQSWQQNNGGSDTVMNNAHAAGGQQIAPLRPTMERSEEEVEQNSRVILAAMIAAAKADGEISAEEQRAILDQVGTEDQEAQMWLQQLVQNTPSVEQIASQVGHDQGLAAEVYLASRIVCGDLDRSEMIYLVDLQRALGLEDSFVEALEKQIGL